MTERQRAARIARARRLTREALTLLDAVLEDDKARIGMRPDGPMLARAATELEQAIDRIGA